MKNGKLRNAGHDWRGVREHADRILKLIAPTPSVGCLAPRPRCLSACRASVRIYSAARDAALALLAAPPSHFFLTPPVSLSLLLLSLSSLSTYGVVLKARHKETGQIVAIKKFKESDEDEQVRKTALREVRILKQLKHDNIVNLIEVFRRKSKLHLVFEYVERTILEDLERNPDGMDPIETKKCLWQLLRSIDYCHAHNIIHRDIKPEVRPPPPPSASVTARNTTSARALTQLTHTPTSPYPVRAEPPHLAQRHPQALRFRLRAHPRRPGRTLHRLCRHALVQRAGAPHRRHAVRQSGRYLGDWVHAAGDGVWRASVPWRVGH